MDKQISLHASCVALDGLAVLLRGSSGSGKSDLALRLVEAGGILVADDQTKLTVTEDGQILTSPPPILAGLLEVRGLGLMRLPYRSAVPLLTVFDLVPMARIERYPEPQFIDLLGVKLPLWQIDPFTASAVAKIKVSVQNQLNHHKEPVP
ncbi:MAG: HPr kinase/phosphatase C-terminal domain-containing protein [Candidatus Pacebacteria bacterium]|nr:HPr kinase/phosphatase C-terminal domain-containing protein [Candidatus Paceibacterota bacterium]